MLLIIWMDLVLYKRRYNIYLRNKFVNLFNIPIRQPQRADPSVRDRCFYCLLWLDVVRAEMVHKHHADIADLEFIYRFLYRLFGMGVLLAGIYFRNDEIISRGTLDSPIASPISFSLPYICAVSMRRTPQFRTDFTEFLQVSPKRE